MIAPVVLAVACESPKQDTPAPSQAARAAVTTRASEPSHAARELTHEGPKQLGLFNITFYYIAEEPTSALPVAKAKPPANENAGDGEVELAAAVPDESVTLYTAKCEEIGDVTREYAAQLALQGTGKLKDGRLLNIWGQCSCAHSPCFKVSDTKWGTAGSGRPLQPFRTVAVDPKVVKLGSLLYVPLLEGRTVPGRAPWGGFVHDGCVVADDTGGGIDGNQLDLFVGRKAYFLGMSGSEGSHSWARKVPVFDGSKLCERIGRRVGRKTGSI